ncbi:MAG: AmmeMemoRadiSam system radical SAM enzyme [Calditrichota bacterium]
MIVPARWQRPLDQGRVRCELCPRYCKIGVGQSGFCYVRRNLNGQLFLTTYSVVTGFGVDPIEKKPLNHFLPGTKILSFGTAGCSLGCRFCQNWSSSKARSDDVRSVEASPSQIVKLAKQQSCPSIAYTYNEPTIFGEFVIDTARLAREQGLRNVMVTNGYITPQAREDIYTWIDAANVDLKSFSEKFYHKLTYSHLKDVLETIEWLVSKTKVWVELTTLLIPGYNDDPGEIKELSTWVRDHCGASTPLHFTAFHPDFKMREVPPTPPPTLTRARSIAQQVGLRYVYVGNVYDPEGQTTYCPACGKALIERGGHNVAANRIKAGCCSCGEKIAGVFSEG